MQIRLVPYVKIEAGAHEMKEVVGPCWCSDTTRKQRISFFKRTGRQQSSTTGAVRGRLTIIKRLRATSAADSGLDALYGGGCCRRR